MPELFHNGSIEEDRWHSGHIKSLDQWLALPGKAATAVCLEPDQSIDPLLEHLAAVELIVVHFVTFMDGRGFSQARELREQGYTGELRASGCFLADQLHYLQRCGFDSFVFDEETRPEEIRAQLDVFDQHYQADAIEPRPLYRRRG